MCKHLDQIKNVKIPLKMFIDFVCFVQNKNWSPYKTYHHKTYLFKTYQRQNLSSQNLSNYKTYQTTKHIKIKTY